MTEEFLKSISENNCFGRYRVSWTQTRQVIISDKLLTNFVYFVDFAEVLPGTNFVGGAFEDLSASDKICQVATNRRHL